MVKLIKSDAEYDIALRRKGELNDTIANAPEGAASPEISELEVLDLVISKYENEHFPEGVRLRMDPCPFKHAQKDLIIELHREHGYFVFCNICKASGPYGKDKITAITNWNDRQKIT